MKKTVLALTLAGMASGLALNAASAADIPGGPRPYYSAPAAGNYYNWAGFYAGINLGYQWGSVSNTSTNPNGLMGGLQGGYNWQSGQFVFRGETDLNLTAADDTFAP
jgi:outer membrane immunogenic protein